MLSVEVAYKGSAADKELAGKVFQALSITGRFMAFDAPITMSLPDLVEAQPAIIRRHCVANVQLGRIILLRP